MRKIDQLLSEYGESHQNPTNKLIHWICVPLIFISLTGFVWSIPAEVLKFALGSGPFSNWASITLFVITLYYMRISFPLALGMAAFSFLSMLLIIGVNSWLQMPVWQVSAIVFVLAWIGQFYGHNVEGKKPSFFKDVQFLLIGPAWLMHFIYKKIGIAY